jgi:predicted peptidase
MSDQILKMKTKNSLARVAVVCLSVFFLSNCLNVYSQHSDLFQHKAFGHEDQILLYRILFPDNFDPSLKYPLILFLHGSGERGSDNEKQLVHGGSFFMADTNRKNFPAIVVFPQCPPNNDWANLDSYYDPNGTRTFSFNPSGKPTTPMQLTIKLLDSLINENWIDSYRVYVGGLSMGGMGTFELLYRKPEVFAAAFPICGGGNPKVINDEIRNVEVWAFHGEVDQVVPPELSEKMIEAYLKAGSKAWLTIFPDVGHNAWDFVFTEPELLPWLFSVRR